MAVARNGSMISNNINKRPLPYWAISGCPLSVIKKVHVVFLIVISILAIASVVLYSGRWETVYNNSVEVKVLKCLAI